MQSYDIRDSLKYANLLEIEEFMINQYKEEQDLIDVKNKKEELKKRLAMQV